MILYARHNVKQLQKEMFRKEHFPRVSMNPQEANYAYLRGEVELVRLPDAEGRIAAKVRFLILRVCCVLFRVKSGVVLFCVTSALWKKGSTCCQVLHRSAGCLYRRT
ncbi:ornithine decarboxylase [Escherichia coli]|uniref:Ornithine decarboxylase n=1 Tax=Escherichia coli TaxID=562 RepID=A0A377B1D9_ECOLX|nr:ornithine decarboxylase [Escherichia coli]